MACCRRPRLARHRGHPGKPIMLTYLGSVYGSTEPTSFVEAVLSLPEEIRSQLRVRFVGHFERSVYRETLLRLGDTVELIGFLPQAEALGLLNQTDFVLLISHDPVNVSAKFYDYLCAGQADGCRGASRRGRPAPAG